MKKSVLALLLFNLFYSSFINAQPGALDSSFGNNGIVSVDLSSSNVIGSSFYKIANTKNNMLIAAGENTTVDAKGNTISNILLAKFFGDGMPDLSFGKNGITQTNIGQDVYIMDLAILPDDKILVCGYVYIDSSNINPADIIVEKYLPNGNLDSSFGSNGIIVIDYGYADLATSILPLKNGDFFIAGDISFNDYQFFHFLILKFTQKGVIDSSFGTNGKVTSNFSPYQEDCRAAVLQNENKILLTGSYAYDYDPDYSLQILARYNLDGTLDSTFGKNGSTIYAPNKHVLKGYDCAIQADGKIILAGASDQYLDGNTSDYALVRYSPNGIVDSSFGNNGVTIIHTGNFDYFDYFNSITLDNTEKIIGVGGNNNKIFRCDKNGNLDSSFGINGIATIDSISDFLGGLQGVAMQQEKIISCGSDFISYTQEPAVIVRCYDNTQNKNPIARIKKWIEHHILHWQNLQDANTAYYTIERSNNAINGFAEISKTPVSGKELIINNESPVYTFKDNNPLQDINYYRVNAVDNNGKITASVILSDAITEETLSVYPNPVKDVLHIKGLNTSEKYEVQITNEKGNLFARASIFNNTFYNINIQNLNAGVYYLSIISSNKNIKTIKFVKE